MTTTQVLDIYRKLLNVKFHPVPRTEEAGGITWHKGASISHAGTIDLPNVYPCRC